MPETISIEEYRNHLFSEKEEWNNFYNPKRCSIEALTRIEVKQKGDGPEKKLYTCSAEVDIGPYYDPKSLHVHVWKSSKLISNFESEQSPNKPFIEFTNVKTGMFCCICHVKNRKYSFKWNRAIYEDNDNNEMFINRNGYSSEDYIENPKIFSVVKVETEKFCEPPNRGFLNWKYFMYKVRYYLNCTKIVYPISTYKSLYLWPWEMSFYKYFKLNIPNYKKSIIFIKSDDDNFRTNYSYIE